MRELSIDLPAVPAPRSARPGWTERTYVLRTLTPMIGGGVEPGTSDDITWLRGGTVRGHLRFWWRAMMRKSPSLIDLARDEAWLWGSAEKPGLVEVEVEVVKASTPQDNWTYFDKLESTFGRDSAADAKYVLFPLQEPKKSTQGKARSSGVVESLQFNLNVRWQTLPIIDNSVRLTIQSWVRYGGIGARTRRGCGTLYCEEFVPKSLDQLAGQFGVPSASTRGSEDWPILARRALLGTTGMRSMQAWLRAIAMYREFRQGLGVGRNPGTGPRPGRSRWPEADSLRNGPLGPGDQNHRPSITVSGEAYPRARLGLPIVFHFKDRDDQSLNSELRPEKSARFSSPLILKAMPYGDGSQAVPMVVALTQDFPANLALHVGSTPILRSGVTTSDPVLATYRNSPLAASSKGDAVEAFLAYAQKQGLR